MSNNVPAVSKAQIEAVMRAIEAGDANVPEEFTGWQNIKSRPVGEWTFDDVTDEQVDQLVALEYEGADPVNRGHAKVLIEALAPRKLGGKKGRPFGSKNKAKPANYTDLAGSATGAQLSRLANRSNYVPDGPMTKQEASDKIQELENAAKETADVADGGF